MASGRVQGEEYSQWNDCPSDVLMIIFKYLDLEAFSPCFKVSKSWRDVGIYYCDHFKLWEKLVNCLYNNGASYKEKSTHNSKELYLNAILWQHVSSAKKNIKVYFQMNNIKHIHVSKDTLIVVCESCVKILNVNNFFLLKTLDITCADYRESGHLAIIVNDPIPGVEELFSLQIKKKIPCCSSHDNIHPLPKITLYSLQEDKCYFFDKSFTLWVYKTECSPHIQLLGRYYSQRALVHSMNVYASVLYIFLLNGSMWHVDVTEKKISLSFHVYAPGWIFDLTPLAFDPFTVVYGSKLVGAMESHISIMNKNKPRNTKVLIFPNLATATLHGDMLLLGFNDGSVEIYNSSKISSEFGGKPELLFPIQFSDQSPITIRELDVYEGNGKHVIFALIGDRIAKVEMSYPHSSTLY